MVCLEMIYYYCAEKFKQGPSFTTFVDMPYFLKTVKPRKIQAAISERCVSTWQPVTFNMAKDNRSSI